ncbi:betaine--homocysteine S-methyltransferase 1-like [Oscarella lobularis]|uniref:betaine--homocysteine S-methyltransferase 1-like n=1 Tax=Oscarella lobularis TaxID=121494 RepID=UPI00331328F8
MSSPKKRKVAAGSEKKGILERMDESVVIGDGGYVFELEKRGYVKAGPWTPEAAVEFPEAVRQLSREFLRAGADVIQAFSFYASEDKLVNRGHYAGKKIGVSEINGAACDIAKEVAAEGDALVLGGLSQTPSYLSGLGKAKVQEEFQKQVDVFVEKDVDFVIGEYFEHVEEAEWAVEVLKKSGKPVGLTMCIGPEGDLHGVSAGDCAVKLAKAGVDFVGVNCHFGPTKSLDAIRAMKDALKANGFEKMHLMVQPLGYHTPDAGKQGFIDLPEFPFALEPRILTRWDCHAYAREAYDLGVRYIGGCCGFLPYHIRAIAEELSKERGTNPPGSEKHGPWGEGLMQHTKPWVRARATRSYWENLKPASGRPHCPALAKPDNWGVTQGDEDLKQQAEPTKQIPTRKGRSGAKK